MEEAHHPTKLRGHSQSVLCCHVPAFATHLVASSSQDGSVCLFDLRNKDTVQRFQCFGEEAVASICFSPANSEIFYAAAATAVYCMDTRLGSLGGEVHKYDFNTDEINQVALNQKGTYLAATDDSGETKIIDSHTHKLQKTLRGVHTNICSTVQFHPQKPWEIVTGGLDAKIVRWDFSKGRPLSIIDIGTTSGNSSADNSTTHFCNPPLIHVLATPEGRSSGDAGKLLAIARGDGAVDVCNITLEKRQESISHGSKSKCAAARKGKAQAIVQEYVQVERQSPQKEYDLHASMDGHTAAVSCVTFAKFEQSGSLIISGSNDKTIKVWDWGQKKQVSLASAEHHVNSTGGPLKLSINHKRKVNWLCTSPTGSENLFVADTSKYLSVYTVL